MRPCPPSIPSLLAVAAMSANAVAEQAAITLDGEMQDWLGVSAAHTDPSGDGGGGGGGGGAGGVDFGRLWIADDDAFLFLRLEIGVELSFNDGNGIVVYLDTDDDAGTGLSVGGIGAELEWRPGQRSGTFHVGGAVVVFHDAIRFRGGPQITGTDFEFGFGREAVPDGSTPLFPGSMVRVLVQDDDAGGDQLPDGDGGVLYTFDQGKPEPPVVPITLDRFDACDLRLITWNVLADSPWKEENPFRRQVQAVTPDILCFQEIYNHNASQTRDLVVSWIGGGPWFAAESNDNKVVSRYQIMQSWELSGNLAVRLDTTGVIGSELLLIVAHLPCCTNDAGRQNEVDEIMAFIRDRPSAPGTPVMITGDLNLVGESQQLTTLLTGDIVDENTWGPDFGPDADDTPLKSRVSRQTEHRLGYTWRNDGSSFWPGHLDYWIFSDSLLTVRKSFVTYTPDMSPSALAENGLSGGDSLASDHLMVTLDAQGPERGCIADLDGDGGVGIGDLLILLAAWGTPGGDLDGDGQTGIGDLLTLLSAWGPCS